METKRQDNKQEVNVEILHTNEIHKDVWLYAVQLLGTEYWVDCFYTEKEAIKYCEKRGYIIKNKNIIFLRR